MGIKAVLFDFNGVIINDESIHEQLISQIMVEENMRPQPGEYRKVCLGRSDRVCIKELFANRGRFPSDEYIAKLIARKSQSYREQLQQMTKLPTFPGLEDFIYKVRVAQLKMAVVSGAMRAEVELVLERLKLAPYFTVIVAGDDITTSKPRPDGYLLAVDRLNQKYPDLQLSPGECVAIEDTPAGIAAAKAAGIPVVGVANTFPFHMMQRQANWAVDYLWDLELDRIQQVYAAGS
ncbi:MAG: HAD family phosphatase [Oscillatoriaceae cyanobacterium]